ncbi:MAG: Gfo/Idh/MocA family protein [Chthoniobacterales bacterium]
MAQTLDVGHLRALFQDFAFFLHEPEQLTTKDTEDTKNLHDGRAVLAFYGRATRQGAMENMLRQPTWHRGWRELMCERILRAPDKLQPSEATFRVGLIGTGRVARRHLYGYRKTRKATVVAAADPDAKQRGKAQSRFRIANVYSAFRDMLRRERLDIVSVCAPPRFHLPAVLAAAEAGVKAVLCEKPIALNLQEADEMIRACRARGVMLVIGHQRRFAPQHQYAKALLEQKTIGELRHVLAECPPDILRAGIHSIDLLLDRLGPLTRVTASLSNGRGGGARGPEEASLSYQSGDRDSWVYLEFANGLQATLRVDARSSLDAKMTFLGDNGVMEVWTDGGLRYRRSQDQSWTIPAMKLNPYLDDFYLEIDSVLCALSSNSPVAVPGEAGRNSLEAVLAILTANRDGRSVSLPLAENSIARSTLDAA